MAPGAFCFQSRTLVSLKVQEVPLELDLQRLPQHVAIYMDGNLRWSKSHGFPPQQGCEAGHSKAKEIARLSSNWGINALTLFAFSTENIRRPKEEVALWIREFEKFFTYDHPDSILKDGFRVQCIGDILKFPISLQDKILEAQEITKENTGLKLTMAAPYGGYYDIVQACQTIASHVEQGLLKSEDIDDKCLRNNMLFAKSDPDIGDPELVIRPGGEQRLSNFLLWHMAYSELVFIKKLWPEFSEDDYRLALIEYQTRDRRFGKH